MAPRGLLLVALCGLLALSFGCRTDTDCLLRGVCTASKCVCDPGYTNANCTQLDLIDAPVDGAYGYSPNVTSWGGVPIYAEGKYHLYVTEMINGCGLCTWGSNSRIVHAVSSTLLGPYLFADQADGVWSHNPHVVVDNSTKPPTYVIFHIGDGSGGNPKHCSQNTTHKSESDYNNKAAGGIMHYSTSLSGPWTPINPPGYSDCNNPAPHISANGSVVVVCTWYAYSAPSFKGPYTKYPFTFSGDGGKGTWEDPFIWKDKRDNWHLLAHVYEGLGPLYSVRVAGQAYSQDGMHWVKTPDQPYSNKVTHTDGSVSAYTTRERPKVVFNLQTGAPLALFNGVGGVPGGDKDTCGIDWTFTLVQPFRGS